MLPESQHEMHVPLGDGIHVVSPPARFHSTLGKRKDTTNDQ